MPQFKSYLYNSEKQDKSLLEDPKSYLYNSEKLLEDPTELDRCPSIVIEAPTLAQAIDKTQKILDMEESSYSIYETVSISIESH